MSNRLLDLKRFMENNCHIKNDFSEYTQKVLILSFLEDLKVPSYLELLGLFQVLSIGPLVDKLYQFCKLEDQHMDPREHLEETDDEDEE